MGPQIRRAFDLADAFRARGRKVVLGGPWVSLDPDEALQHADAVVVGEAESRLGGLLEDAAAGRLQPRYQGTPADLAARSERSTTSSCRCFDRRRVRSQPLLPLVLPLAGVDLARLPAPLLVLRRPDLLPPQLPHAARSSDVVEDFRRVRALGGRRVLILDDNPIGDRAHARELFRALAPARPAVGEPVHDQDRPRRGAARPGRALGLPHAHHRLRERVPAARCGSTARASRTPTATRATSPRIRRRGIQVIGLFMVGLDGDGPESFAATSCGSASTTRSRSSSSSPPAPSPAPGTTSEMKRAGRILSTTGTSTTTARPSCGRSP